MPVYHYTFHAFGTWMPDRPQGFNKHGKSRQAPSLALAKHHRKLMHQPPTLLTNPAQQHALQTLIHSQTLQRFELYAVAADGSHLHVIAAWRDERNAIHLRAQIKSSLTRALNNRFGKRQWFVAKAGQTPVNDEEHLHHLVHEYLPKHSGIYWCRSAQIKNRP